MLTINKRTIAGTFSKPEPVTITCPECNRKLTLTHASCGNIAGFGELLKALGEGDNVAIWKCECGNIVNLSESKGAMLDGVCL